MIEVGTVDFEITSYASDNKCIDIVQERMLLDSAADEEH